MFTLFFAGFAATLLMTGLAWMVQLVHYPSFRYVEPRKFPEFHRFHSNRITLIAAPLMLAELGTAIILVFAPGFIPYSLSIPAARFAVLIISNRFDTL